MHTEVDGERIFEWLKGLRSPSEAALLVGCIMYDGDRPEVDHRVSGVSVDPVRIDCNGTNFSGKRLRRAYLVDRDDQVSAAIEAGKSEFRKAYEEAKQSLASWGVNAAKINGEAALTLAAAMAEVRSGRPLSSQLRVEVFGVLNRHHWFDLGMKMAKAAIRVALEQGRFDPYLYVQLASFARECQRLPTALTATNIIFKRSPGEIGVTALQILHTQRAAILMDLFESTGDLRMLEEARRCVIKSEELGGSELQEALAGRLFKLCAAAQTAGT